MHALNTLLCLLAVAGVYGKRARVIPGIGPSTGASLKAPVLAVGAVPQVPGADVGRSGVIGAEVVPTRSTKAIDGLGQGFNPQAPTHTSRVRPRISDEVPILAGKTRAQSQERPTLIGRALSTVEAPPVSQRGDRVQKVKQWVQNLFRKKSPTASSATYDATVLEPMLARIQAGGGTAPSEVTTGEAQTSQAVVGRSADGLWRFSTLQQNEDGHAGQGLERIKDEQVVGLATDDRVIEQNKDGQYRFRTQSGLSPESSTSAEKEPAVQKAPPMEKEIEQAPPLAKEPEPAASPAASKIAEPAASKIADASVEASAETTEVQPAYVLLTAIVVVPIVAFAIYIKVS